MEIPLTLSIPYLWGENNDIKKNDWGSINYLVGPNGTGKSLFGEKLKEEIIVILVKTIFL